MYLENRGLTNSVLPLSKLFSGKARDVYDCSGNLLIVTTDRISAMDNVLPGAVPDKGRVLNLMTIFWMEMMKDIVPNHLLETDSSKFPEELALYRDFLKDRAVIARKAKPYPIECIVRGYITGSGWKDYQKTGMICGHKLPENLVESQKIEPIFTPSTKAAQGEHDENISVKDAGDLVGDKISDIERISLAIYKKASEYAEKRGIIIADTKLEFGEIDGRIYLIDEVLTPDSSRFWDKSDYEAGRSQKSFDKQPLRDWIKEHGENIPAKIYDECSERYKKAYNILAGQTL